MDPVDFFSQLLLISLSNYSKKTKKYMLDDPCYEIKYQLKLGHIRLHLCNFTFIVICVGKNDPDSSGKICPWEDLLWEKLSLGKLCTGNLCVGKICFGKNCLGKICVGKNDFHPYM